MQLRGGGLFSSESKSAKDARKAQEAAVAEKNEELEKVLECPTCLNLLYQPITLLCGHSFCGVCLKSWLRSGSRICPMCRAPISHVVRLAGPAESVDGEFVFSAS